MALNMYLSLPDAAYNSVAVTVNYTVCCMEFCAGWVKIMGKWVAGRRALFHKAQLPCLCTPPVRGPLFRGGSVAGYPGGIE